MRRAPFLSLVLVSAVAMATGCSKKTDDAAKADEVASQGAAMGVGASRDPKANPSDPATGEQGQAFVETQPTGSIAWNVRPSGEVKAALVGKDGQPLAAPVTGTMVWTVPGQEPRTTPIAYEGGTLSAMGPSLSADVTEVRYDLDANGTAWTGVLHLPPGGTLQIVSDAQAQATVEVPEGQVAPHGGRIQVVGPDRLELVSNPETGEVRVYVLDADYHAVAVGPRRITLGVVAERSEVVALEAEPAGLYFSAVWGVTVDPWRLDVSMRVGPSVYFGVWGYRPGVALYVGAAAPRYTVRVGTGWGPPLVRGRVLVAGPRIAVGMGVGVGIGGPRVGFAGGGQVSGGVRFGGPGVVQRGGAAGVVVGPRVGPVGGPRVAAPARGAPAGGGKRR